MAEKTADELAAENDKLQRENQSLADRLRNRKDTGENEALRRRIAELEQVRAAEKGPAAGLAVCFQHGAEPFCRPAKIVSDGFTELVRVGPGDPLRHALLEYGEPPHVIQKDEDGNPFTPGHTFQTDRPWDSMGAPDTWHLCEECPRRGQPGCPYGNVEAPQAP